MSQHDFTIANDTGANVRGDIEDAIQALASSNAGATAPTTTYPGMIWIDSSGPYLKVRNAADTGWITTAVSLFTDNEIGYNLLGVPVKIRSNAGIQFAGGANQTQAYPGMVTYKNWDSLWSTTSTTAVQVGDVTDRFDCAITPTSASNAVLVHMDLRLSYNPPPSLYPWSAPVVTVYRGSTPVFVGGSYTYNGSSHYPIGSAQGATGSQEFGVQSYSAHFIDTPATTAATTYSAYVLCPASGMTIKTNEPYTGTAAFSTISSWVLQETPASAG